MNFVIQFILRAINRVGPAVAAARGQLGSLFAAGGKGLLNYAKKGFTAAAAFRFMKGSMEESLNRGKQFTNLADRMGLTTDQIAALDRTAEQAGVSVNALGKSFVAVQKFGQEGMTRATEKASKMVTALGLNNDQLTKMKAGGPAALAEMAKVIQQIPNEAKRAYMWQQILGEKYFEMKGILESTPAAIEKMTEGQTSMSKETSDGVTRLQRIWGDLWAKISVWIAELLEAFEPLLGVLGNVALGIVAIFRFITQSVGGFFDLLILAGAGLQKILGRIFGKPEWVKDADKAIQRVSERTVKRVGHMKKIYNELDESTKRGNKAITRMGSGEALESANLRNIEMPDRRSADDMLEYEKAMREQAKIENLRQQGLQPEEKKADLLREQLQIMDKQLEIMEQRYGSGMKETKAYLDYLNERKKIEDQIYKTEIAHKDKVRDTENKWIEFSNKRTLELMDKELYWEEDIFKQKMDQEIAAAERISSELEELRRRDYVSDEEFEKKRMELAEKVHEIQMGALDERNRLREISTATGAVSSIQKVGGGGDFSPVSIAQKQLDAQRETNDILRRVEGIVGRSAMGGRQGFLNFNPRYGDSKYD